MGLALLSRAAGVDHVVGADDDGDVDVNAGKVDNVARSAQSLKAGQLALYFAAASRILSPVVKSRLNSGLCLGHSESELDTLTTRKGF